MIRKPFCSRKKGDDAELASGFPELYFLLYRTRSRCTLIRLSYLFAEISKSRNKKFGFVQFMVSRHDRAFSITLILFFLHHSFIDLLGSFALNGVWSVNSSCCLPGTVEFSLGGNLRQEKVQLHEKLILQRLA